MKLVVSVLGIVLSSSPIWAAPQSSTRAFHSTVTKPNQCSGEPMVIQIDGTIDVVADDAGGFFHYKVKSKLTGTATGAASGTVIRFGGTEEADFEDAAPRSELTMLNHVRVKSSGRDVALVGFDTQTIALDARGNITNVTNDFEFTCD